MSAKLVRNTLLLSGAFSLGLFARAQQPAPAHNAAVDVAITYVAERAKVSGIDCGCFWLQGGSGDVALSFFHGFGLAADLTGVHSGNIANGVPLDKVMIVVGPRYTLRPASWEHFGGDHDLSLFGEGLVGGVHGFNSEFPSATGLHGAADSFALQAGGGVNVGMKPWIGIRAIEADYVRSTLSNGANNVQNDLRLSAGIYFRFHP